MLRPLAIVLLLAAPALAGWSDQRFVRLDDGGSASFVRIGDGVFLLSCAHRDARHSVAVGDRVQFHCADDSRSTATVVAVFPDDSQSEPFRDCSVWSFPPDSVRLPAHPLTITTRPLRRGQKVWVNGFPCPRGEYTPRTTSVIEDGGKLWLSGISTPGESGGAIVNEAGELCGTLTGFTDDGRTICCGSAVATELCRQVALTWCPNGQCQNGRCPNGGGQQWAQQQPAPTPQPQLLPPPQPLNPLIPQPPPAPKFDWDEFDKRQQKILVAITAQKCECQPTDLTQLNQKLDLLLVAVNSKPQPPVIPPATAEQHVVIVADHNAPYWQRLAEAIATTKKTYSGIQDTPLPPFAVGVHPKAVVYRNSVPVRIVSGQYEVENLLARLARGEPI